MFSHFTLSTPYQQVDQAFVFSKTLSSKMLSSYKIQSWHCRNINTDTKVPMQGRSIFCWLASFYHWIMVPAWWLCEVNGWLNWERAICLFQSWRGPDSSYFCLHLNFAFDGRGLFVPKYILNFITAICIAVTFLIQILLQLWFNIVIYIPFSR